MLLFKEIKQYQANQILDFTDRGNVVCFIVKTANGPAVVKCFFWNQKKDC